jgi:hypothetical protein
MVHAITEYIFRRIKLATAGKEFPASWNTWRNNSAKCNDDDNRSLAAYKIHSILGYENQKFMEHIQKYKLRN